MNIFLVHPSFEQSAKILAVADPIRARKQLLECCQLLAHFGPMRKASGEYYKLGHSNHPVTRHMRISYAQYCLCFNVAFYLAKEFPAHACATSLKAWHMTYFHSLCNFNATPTGIEIKKLVSNLILCRKGQPQIFVQSIAEYAALMREYCISTKGMTL